jgi:SAM-dependent methyltransferase
MILAQMQICNQEKLSKILLHALEQDGIEGVQNCWNLFNTIKSIDDSEYDKDYHTFKKLETLHVFEDKFYKPNEYTYAAIEHEGLNTEFKFQYMPPSITYMPLWVELYKLYGGDFKLQSHDPKNQEKEFYSKLKEKLGHLRTLEFGCGPGYGMAILKRLGTKTIGIDKEKFPPKAKAPGVNVICDDIFNIPHNRLLANKQFDLIYSQDVIEGELLKSREQARRLISIANSRLRPGGMQVHMVPYKQDTGNMERLMAAIQKYEQRSGEQIHIASSRGIIKDGQETTDARGRENMSRYLLLSEADISELAGKLGSEVIRDEVVNHHWLLALRKSSN